MDGGQSLDEILAEDFGDFGALGEDAVAVHHAPHFAELTTFHLPALVCVNGCIAIFGAVPACCSSARPR